MTAVRELQEPRSFKRGQPDRRRQRTRLGEH